MNVFVSWSGERSNLLAMALKQLLPDVIQNLSLWMSEHDIQAGSRWGSDLASRLELCELGIACLTPENQNAPWLLFEAGALSKNLATGRLIPLLLDLKPAQVTFPLAQFQLVEADRVGITKLILDINRLNSPQVSEERLQRQIDRWWPEFDAAIKTAATASSGRPKAAERTDKEILEEILAQVRASSNGKQTGRDSGIAVYVDTRPYLGLTGKTHRFGNADRLSLEGFLDKIWAILDQSSDTPPYTYGTRWVLYNQRTKTRMDNLAADYIASEGAKNDRTPLLGLEIQPWDNLDILRVGPFEPTPRNEA